MADGIIKIKQGAAVEHDTLWTALRQAQSAIGAIVRDAEGQARGGKYRYAALDTVLDAVRPALSEAGLVLLQPTVIDGEMLVVDTRIVHVGTGEHVNCPYPAGPLSAQHQTLGSGVTYARRYALMSLLALAPEDDDGATAGAAGTKSQARPPSKPATAPGPRPDHTPPPDGRGPERDLIEQALARIAVADTQEELKAVGDSFRADLKAISDAGYQQVVSAFKARKAVVERSAAAEVFP